MARSKSPRRRNRSRSPTRLVKLNSSEGNTTNTTSNNAELRMTVLGLNDLPLREQPSYLTLKVHRNGKSLSTGPPTSRHKDRNSFKFASPLSQNLVITSKHLAALYAGTLYVEVVYQTQPTQNLTGSMAVQELIVNDTQPTKVDLTLTGNGVDLLDPLQPTLKLQLELQGNLRPEMATLQQLFKAYFGVMDQVEASCLQLVPETSKIHKTYFLVPAVPLATATIIVAPIVTGVCVLFFPLFIPILFAVLTVLACGLVTGSVLVASTSSGRTWIQEQAWVPSLDKVARTETGQALLYPTGPRPNPVSLTKLVVPSQDDLWARLALSLIIDAIGSASYLVPVVGEITDIVWAPLQTILIMAMYDTTTPHLKYVSFVEEILPLTDFVPSATIGWAVQFGPQLLKKGLNSNEAVPMDLILQETGASAKQK